MATETLPAIPADIAFITGPTMLGICFNWGFLGILVMQLYFYSQNYSKDSMRLKALVYGLSFLDILQTCMVTADAFHWFVFGFGNMNRLDEPFLNSWDVVLIDSVVALIVQSFYCWRIYLLQDSLILPVFIVLVSLMQCGGGVATAVVAHQLGHLSLISTEVAQQTIWLVGSAVADILITVSLSWTLLRKRSHIPSASHGMIKKIVALTVETNAVTTITAIIGLILFLAVPQHSALVVPPTAILSKLYTNCLIAVLNNRRQTANGTIKDFSSSHETSRNQFPSARTGGPSRSVVEPSHDREQMKVQIVRSVDFKADSDMELGTMQSKKSQNGMSWE
ncbi:hypothetical protein HYPSUDRAFT_36570 [Hypholoma sublateritium FD-334 SS-4]|uniref:DUF6534 domain-containing protein n=1 Tax=Hypholoma sublateritium (strain FD-334 SS-4) TaxID=945553 RepID=A0A0D2MQM1_HYPSF|nr:hypothetical protein HYPSUDRAFT_36570 [Hypholoma sublateritium FD-334 SS-4]